MSKLLWRVDTSVDHDPSERPFGTNVEAALRFAAGRDAHVCTDYVRIYVSTDGEEWRFPIPLDFVRSLYGEG